MGPGPMTAGLRIVVVENDALIAMLLSELLTGMGHEVCAVAMSEDEAVDCANRIRPDLMIIDSGLDRGTGMGAMRRILASMAVAHVFVTGNARAVLDQDAHAVVVTKPFTMLDLQKGITQARLKV